MEFYTYIFYFFIYIYFIHFIQGTWKESLRTSFKNYRRSSDDEPSLHKPAGETSQCATSKPPSAKRFKLDQSTTNITDEEFDKSLESLKAEFMKNKKSRNQAEIKNLMDLTFDRRRVWITQERPLVNDIVKKFPPLKSSKSVRFVLAMLYYSTYYVLQMHREFRKLMNIEGRLTIMEAWPEWEQKIIEYAKMDSTFRPTIKEILKELESDKEDIIFQKV